MANAIRTVCVCGSRNWTDGAAIRMALSEAVADGALMLIHGDARGADLLANNIGIELGLVVLPFPADWTLHGKKAGPIRNAQMLREGQPDRVYAFPLGRSAGTRDMMRRAIAAGVEVREWDVALGGFWRRR